MPFLKINLQKNFNQGIMQKLGKYVAIFVFLAVAGLFSFAGMYILGMTDLFHTDLVKALGYFFGGMVGVFWFIKKMPDIGMYIKANVGKWIKEIIAKFPSKLK